MPNRIRGLCKVDSTSFPYLCEEHVTIPHKSLQGLVRCNIYRPKSEEHTVHMERISLMNSKMIRHDSNRIQSLTPVKLQRQIIRDVTPKHKSVHSSWGTPDPAFWAAQGYAVLRADEVDSGQSPGLLDTMSKSTTDAFVDVIEWAAEQTWSNGKVDLVGISYFGGSQWRVAACRPNDPAAMILCDGMNDYYRDRCRHGGILTEFLKWWFSNSVASN
ncbi:hypothetical protein THARTR1_01906 [Trichoderma harzianum]|uniref:Xaa-Pro dipeptidyl-peptidase-like domain-containing protein n=1 Tax=Trichoderma harzianum TaxID=5544 RepID=A0A2K0UK94_TRIHA|nr:hypothetical protein THARTR1_01906 [Trichoderma harzianum]